MLLEIMIIHVRVRKLLHYSVIALDTLTTGETGVISWLRNFFNDELYHARELVQCPESTSSSER